MCTATIVRRCDEKQHWIRETSEETEGIHGQVTLEDGLTDGRRKQSAAFRPCCQDNGRKAMLSQ